MDKDGPTEEARAALARRKEEMIASLRKPVVIYVYRCAACAFTFGASQATFADRPCSMCGLDRVVLDRTVTLGGRRG